MDVVLMFIQAAVAFDFDMNAVLYQFAEEIALYVGFYNAACKVNGQDVLKTDDRTVGAGGEGLSHIDVKPFDAGFHIFRNMQGAHVGESCR